jgi:hypothetical protein
MFSTDAKQRRHVFVPSSIAQVPHPSSVKIRVSVNSLALLLSAVGDNTFVFAVRNVKVCDVSRILNNVDSELLGFWVISIVWYSRN